MSHAQSTAHNHVSRDTKPVGVCHGCDAMRALARTSPAVATAMAIMATAEAGATSMDVHAAVSRWDQLLEWVTDDSESRAVEIVVTVAGISYPEDDSHGERPDVEFAYQVEACDTWMYGDNDTYTWVKHQGSGPTLEQAADAALRMIAEFWNEEASKAAHAVIGILDEVRP